MTDKALFIGHSLVGPTMPAIFNAFMADQGSTVRADAQVINGAPLIWNWNNGPNAEGVNARAVLPSGEYGSVIVTEAIPLDPQIQWNDTQGYAKRYSDLALSANPNTRFYLYETWHEIGTDTQAWRDRITGDQGKWQGIIDYVNQNAPAGAPEAFVIPAGQAMGNLHDAIVAGQVPGLSSIRDLFSDNIHLNDLGHWFIAATHAEAVAGLDASSLPLSVTVSGTTYAGPDAATAQVMADIIAQTVPSVEPPTMTGGPGADMLVGDGDDNVLQGFDGNDVLIGGGGDDSLDGGAGWDIARFSGSQDHYSMTISATGITIEDRRSGGDGTDQLDSIEEAEFIDAGGSGPVGRIVMGQLATVAQLDQSQMESLIELYIAFFDRAPDAIGLSFWGTALAYGLSMEEIARLFTSQAEVMETYPQGVADETFAAMVYQNVLGREADDAGFNFWTTALSTGAIGRDQFILTVLEGAKAAPQPGLPAGFAAQQLADQQYLADKTDLGAYFAVHLGMSDVDNARAVTAAFDGTAQSLQDAAGLIDTFHNAAMNPGSAEFLMPIVGVLDDPGW